MYLLQKKKLSKYIIGTVDPKISINKLILLTFFVSQDMHEVCYVNSQKKKGYHLYPKYRTMSSLKRL